MINKYQHHTQKRAITIAILLAALFALNAYSADRRIELRNRLDSLEVEKQVLKRQGKPIDDLEAAGALLRDSLVEMRSNPATAEATAEVAEGGKLWAVALAAVGSFLEKNLSFRPAGLFDWVIVGTGAVAVLSALLLLVGLATGKRKNKAAPRKAAGRKVNLAPTGPRPAVESAEGSAEARYRFGGITEVEALAPTASTYNAGGRMNGPNERAPGPEQVPPALESLMQNLRKAASAKQQAPAAEPAPQTQMAITPPPPPPPPPPLPPPPLIVSAPDTPHPPPPAAGASVPKVGSPGFTSLVITESKGGLSDAEISRRYQVSVDQVRLILRMMGP